MQQRTVNNVPDSEANFVMAAMKADGAQVTKTRQSNGLWTVIGVFHDHTGRAPEAAIEPTVQPFSDVAAVVSNVGNRAIVIDVLARTIWGEARGESRRGKEAVAAVVLNRLKRGPARRYGGTIEEVCQRKAQFSCWNENAPNRLKLIGVEINAVAFRECVEIAERAVSGLLNDPTGGATHYHTINVSPNWSQGETPCARIGSHVFFNDIA
jgi:N-acetylmuramoyl-L-alanine amidase